MTCILFCVGDLRALAIVLCGMPSCRPPSLTTKTCKEASPPNSSHSSCVSSATRGLMQQVLFSLCLPLPSWQLLKRTILDLFLFSYVFPLYLRFSVYIGAANGLFFTLVSYSVWEQEAFFPLPANKPCIGRARKQTWSITCVTHTPSRCLHIDQAPKRYRQITPFLTSWRVLRNI